MIAALRGSRLLLAVAPVVGATAFAWADPDRSDLNHPRAHEAAASENTAAAAEAPVPAKIAAAKVPPSKAKVDSKLIPAKEL